jgi:hypothetical protein
VQEEPQSPKRGDSAVIAPQDFVVALHHGDGSGQYVMPLHLAAQASTTIDIGMLIAMAQPDANGNLIPNYIQEGSVVFSNPKGRRQWMTLALSGAFYNRRRGTSGEQATRLAVQLFPRERESALRTFGSGLLRDWVPAFAGMTAAASAHFSRTTPPSHSYLFSSSIQI